MFLDPRVLRPVQVFHRQQIAEEAESARQAYSWGGFADITAEQLTIVQTQILDPPATATPKYIRREDFIGGRYIDDGSAIKWPVGEPKP